MNMINFIALLSRKTDPKALKDKILKNLVGGPTQPLESGMTGLLDWRVVVVMGFEGFTECKYYLFSRQYNYIFIIIIYYSYDCPKTMPLI